MIVTTKWADLPYDDVNHFMSPRWMKMPVNTPEFWEGKIRGKELQIVTPPINPIGPWTCSGPFYKRADCNRIVCIHMTQLGD